MQIAHGVDHLVSGLVEVGEEEVEYLWIDSGVGQASGEAAEQGQSGGGRPRRQDIRRWSDDLLVQCMAAMGSMLRKVIDTSD
jgi:hypothetical protein